MTWPIVVAGALAGAIVGSFLATLIVRWPRGEQVIRGRSRCDHCLKALGPADMIPLISFAVNRGRCRGCSGKIDRTHPLVELAAAVLAATGLAIRPDLGGVALALFWLLLIAPAILDTRHYWLPDRLTLVLAVAGLVAGGFIAGVPLDARLIGGVAGFLSLWVIDAIYRSMRGRQGLGQGDPKLLGAIGLWAGGMALPLILVLASVGGLATALLLGKSRFDRMPFGTLLAMGAGLWAGLASAGVIAAEYQMVWS